MSILKKKIFLALQAKSQQAKEPADVVRAERTPSEETSDERPVTRRIETKPISKKRRKGQGDAITPMKTRCTKNIVKNYGKVIATFACSDVSMSYLEEILKKISLPLSDFMEYMRKIKSSIEGIDSFRTALVIKDTDSETCKNCKRVFQKIGEVFIRYFSVNWIYSSRIVHKLTYLKYRFKILRRIQNPEMFTYLKG